MNFLCFRGNRVNIQEVSTDKAIVIKNFGGIQNVRFFEAYYINACVKFDDFFLAERKRKSLSMCRLSKNSPFGTRPTSIFRSLKKQLFLVTSSK